jgi:hypothetical protein
MEKGELMAIHLFIPGPVKGHDPKLHSINRVERYRKPVGHRYRFDDTGNGRIYKLDMVGFYKA